MRKGKPNARRLRRQRMRKRRDFLRKHPGEMVAEMKRWTVSYEHEPPFVSAGVKPPEVVSGFWGEIE